MEEITNQLLDKIFYLQEQLAEERQENKELKKDKERDKEYINYLYKENKKTKEKINHEGGLGLLVGIGFTISLYLFVKFLLYFFF